MTGFLVLFIKNSISKSILKLWFIIECGEDIVTSFIFKLRKSIESHIVVSTEYL